MNSLKAIRRIFSGTLVRLMMILIFGGFGLMLVLSTSAALWNNLQVETTGEPVMATVTRLEASDLYVSFRYRQYEFTDIRLTNYPAGTMYGDNIEIYVTQFSEPVSKGDTPYAEIYSPDGVNSTQSIGLLLGLVFLTPAIMSIRTQIRHMYQHLPMLTGERCYGVVEKIILRSQTRVNRRNQLRYQVAFIDSNGEVRRVGQNQLDFGIECGQIVYVYANPRNPARCIADLAELPAEGEQMEFRAAHSELTEQDFPSDWIMSPQSGYASIPFLLIFTFTGLILMVAGGWLLFRALKSSAHNEEGRTKGVACLGMGALFLATSIKAIHTALKRQKESTDSTDGNNGDFPNYFSE